MGAGVSTSNDNSPDQKLTHSASNNEDEIFNMEPEEGESGGDVTLTTSSISQSSSPKFKPLRPRMTNNSFKKIPPLNTINSPDSQTSPRNNSDADEYEELSLSFESRYGKSSNSFKSQSISTPPQTNLKSPSNINNSQTSSIETPVRSRSRSLFQGKANSNSKADSSPTSNLSPVSIRKPEGQKSPMSPTSTTSSPLSARGIYDDKIIYSQNEFRSNSMISKPSSQAKGIAIPGTNSTSSPYSRSFHDSHSITSKNRKNLDEDQIISRKFRSHSEAPPLLSQSLPPHLSYFDDEVKTTTSVLRGIDDQGRKTVNQYSFIQQIGSGTSSKVKLCVNCETGEKVAIKVINRSLMKTVNGFRKFRPKGITYESILREIAILKKLRHPNIVRVIEVIDDPTADKMYIVLEHVDGGELLKMDNEGNVIPKGNNEKNDSTTEDDQISISEDSEFGDVSPYSPSTDDDSIQERRTSTLLQAKTFSPIEKMQTLSLNYDTVSRYRSRSAAPAYNPLPIRKSSQNLQSARSSSSLSKIRDENYQPKEDGTIPEPLARKYFRSLVSALNYIHKNNIVHRDIKPENILIEKSTNTLKLSDFGVSQFTQGDDDSFEDTMGTPAFYPPESCSKGRTYGRAADVWSCGITLYCMLFGRLPFRPKSGNQGVTLVSLFKSIENDELELPDNISDELRDLFLRILDKNPNTRITAEELIHHPWLLLDPTSDEEEEVLDDVNDDEISTAITVRHHFKILDTVFSKLRSKLPSLRTPRSPLSKKQPPNQLKPITPMTPSTPRVGDQENQMPPTPNSISSTPTSTSNGFFRRNRASSLFAPKVPPSINSNI